MNTLTRRAAVALAIFATAVAAGPTSFAAVSDVSGPANGDVAAAQPTEADDATIETRPDQRPALVTLAELLPAVRTATAARDAETAALVAAITAAEAHAQALAEAEAEAQAEAAAQSAAPGWPWSQLVQCEASGNWQIANGNGYYGGLQFAHSTWVSYGGQAHAAYAHQASPSQQVEIAQRVVSAHGGSYGAWPGCQAKLGLP